jgi:hypothetical protein
MKQTRTLAVTLACAVPLLLAACGGGDSNGVTGASSAPQFPSVGGRWEGTLTILGVRFAAILDLSQSQQHVEGTLRVKGYGTNDVTGTISEFGVLEFEGEPPSGCISYSTIPPHLGLEERNTMLEGPLQRVSPSLGGPCDGFEPLITENGELELRRSS